MSGGVDSSVAAALLCEAGHEVVGTTLKLWGGPQDSGCCSVGDVEDARRVAHRLGITHRVFNLVDEFEAGVVQPYIEAHAAGRTPNPCVECNRSVKFGRLLRRADVLGFDAIATGHHARVTGDRLDGASSGSRRWRLWRGADRAKDQSYVLYMLGQRELSRILFPIGDLTKAEVRAKARERGLATANKAESQETCFVTATGGREAFLSSRMELHSGDVIDRDGRRLSRVGAVELVTIGQRRGLGVPGARGAGRRYAVDVDVARGTIRVGGPEELLIGRIELAEVSWVGGVLAEGTPVRAQASAHGRALPGAWDGVGAVELSEPARRVAPGQAVVLYDAEAGDEVLGGGPAA